jgi:hypothetical protein
MFSYPISLIREIIAGLMCSELYFNLPPADRLALVKQMAERHREVAMRYLPS